VNPRRVFVGWFGLIVLYTALTQSEKIAGLLGVTTEVTKRLSDPNVPLLRNRAGAQLAGSSPVRANSTAPGDGAAGGYGGSTLAPYPVSSGGQYIGSRFVPNGR
jgi:hypothetical protein